MHKDCDKHYFKKPEFYRLTGENNYVRIDAEDIPFSLFHLSMFFMI